MVKNLPASGGDAIDSGLIPCQEKERQPTPVFLPGKSHGLVGYSPRGHKELDTTEELTSNNNKTQSSEKHTTNRNWGKAFIGGCRNKAMISLAVA